jgi:hypothetical protein
MRFSITFLVAALVTLVASQATKGNNAFSVPIGGYLLKAGQSYTFTWTKLTGSTVTLKLRDGSNGDLNAGVTIASSIPNKGTFTFNVPATTVEGNSYTVEIINDQDPTDVNYTGQFDILSSVKAGASTASTASGASQTASSTGSSSGVTSTTGSASSASTTGSATSGASSSVATTGSSKSASSTSSGPSSSSPPATVPSGNAASGLKVGGGMLALAVGVVAAL